MKSLLAIIPLVFCSCTTTTATYEGSREFPVEATQLDITVEYSAGFCNGSARTTTILGFIRLGRSEFAYGNSGMGIGAALPIPFLSSGGGESTESAAIYDALAKTGGDVLGFPLFRKKVTNFFLWTVEDVWVKGVSGTVSH